MFLRHNLVFSFDFATHEGCNFCMKKGVLRWRDTIASPYWLEKGTFNRATQFGRQGRDDWKTAHDSGKFLTMPLINAFKSNLIYLLLKLIQHFRKCLQTAGLCSNSAWWSLVHYFFSLATWKFQFLHRNHIKLETIHFAGSENWVA